MTIDEKREALLGCCDGKYCTAPWEGATLCQFAGNEFCDTYSMDDAPESIIEERYELFFGKDSTKNQTTVIQDSGERREFSTGAVRDMAEGKGDMISMPWEALLRLSKHYEAGAKKYDRWNYRKGIPVSSFIDSACRHLAKYQCGCDDEDHLAAAAFNILGAMLMENNNPDMQDLPARSGKNTFSYFEEETK